MGLYEKTVETGKLKLRTPILVGEVELKELDFPLKDLRGRDCVDAQNEYEMLTGAPLEGMVESNKGFLTYFGSKVAKVPYEAILQMPIADFNAVALVMQRFLFRGE